MWSHGAWRRWKKSAIALRMTNGTGQFIRDYMFPKSREDTVSTISDQLGAYREIKERVDDLEHRIGLLDAVHEAHVNLTKTRADMVRIESILRIIEIEGQKARLEARTQDLSDAVRRIEELEKEKISLETAQEDLRSELVEVEAGLKPATTDRRDGNWTRSAVRRNFWQETAVSGEGSWTALAAGRRTARRRTM